MKAILAQFLMVLTLVFASLEAKADFPWQQQDEIISINRLPADSFQVPRYVGPHPETKKQEAAEEEPIDTDQDGVNDFEDNCPEVGNPFQEDADFDGVGDACEDDDKDEIFMPNDNCPSVANVDQNDADGDLVGDACDNCKEVSNPIESVEIEPGVFKLVASAQLDSDGDGKGTACDNDNDMNGNDGIVDEVDNCPSHFNPDQKNIDGDKMGDACDDGDHDGFIDSLDNCPNKLNPDQQEACFCPEGQHFVGSTCVSDEVPPLKCQENEILVEDKCQPCAADEVVVGGQCVNPTPLGPICGNGTLETGEQCDDSNTTVGDGCSDACTTEIVILPPEVTCPAGQHVENEACVDNGVTPPPPSEESPPDADGDGVPDATDNCPNIANPDQSDVNEDKMGDLCQVCTPPLVLVEGVGVCNVDSRSGGTGGTGTGSGGSGGSGGSAGTGGTDVSPNTSEPADPDEDGISDAEDNCPGVENPEQADGDADGMGDACDPHAAINEFADTDEDGELDIADNCPGGENPEQTDGDSIGGADGMGDACDPHPAFNDTIQAEAGGGGCSLIPEK